MLKHNKVYTVRTTYINFYHTKHYYILFRDIATFIKSIKMNIRKVTHQLQDRLTPEVREKDFNCIFNNSSLKKKKKD